MPKTENPNYRPKIKGHTIIVCNDCYDLKGKMCNEPACVFCRRTMKEVSEYLDVLHIRPIVDEVQLP